jgi:hypothetical protein
LILIKKGDWRIAAKSAAHTEAHVLDRPERSRARVAVAVLTTFWPKAHNPQSSTRLDQPDAANASRR